jgi:hypothetical protein
LFYSPFAAGIHFIFASNVDSQTVDSQPFMRKVPAACTDKSYNPDYPASVSPAGHINLSTQLYFLSIIVP